MWPRVVSDGPSHHEAWGGACVSCANALQKMMLTRSTLYMCTYITRIDNLLSSLKTTERHSTLQSSLSWDLSPAASKWSLVTQQIQHVFRFLSWRLPPLLAQCINLDMRLYCTAVQNLVYECGNVVQTTAGSRDTSPIHCAQHVHPVSHRPILRPHSNGWSC